MKRLATLLLLCLAVVATASAQIVGAGTDDGGRPKTTKVKKQRSSKPKKPAKVWPKYRATGPLLLVEAGYPLHGGLTFGGQMGKSFMMGVGGSFYASLRDGNNHMVPVYMHMRLGSNGYRFGVFGDVKLGIDALQLGKQDWFDKDTPLRWLYGSAALGIYIHKFAISAGVMTYYDEKITYGKGTMLVKEGLHLGITAQLSYNIMLKKSKKTDKKPEVKEEKREEKPVERKEEQ